MSWNNCTTPCKWSVLHQVLLCLPSFFFWLLSKLSIFFLNTKRLRTMLAARLISECPDPPTSLLILCFILFTDYPLSRGLNTNCLCFALRSSLIKPPPTIQTFFTFTLLPGSFALLVRIPPLHTRSSGQNSFCFQASTSWNQLPVSVIMLPVSVLLSVP